MVKLVGRGDVVAAIEAALAAAAEGHGTALDLVGLPGAGKTALADTAVDMAQRAGFAVRRTTVTEWEHEFPWSALTALLVPSATDRPPSRDDADDAVLRALVTHGHTGGDTVAPFRVALTALRWLAEVAEQAPLLLVVDDLHWADTDSRRALAAVSRRLAHERIVLLTCRRSTDPLPGFGRPVEVGPLPAEDVQVLLRRLGVAAASLRARIVEASGGLPLVATAVARDLTAGERTGQVAVTRLPAIGSVALPWYRPMFDRLSPDAFTAALVAAADTRGAIVTVNAALRRLGTAEGSLEAAEATGLLALHDERIQFVHPTARAAIYESAAAGARRSAHAALADALANPDSLDWVWHRLRALTGPDAEVAAAVAGAAGRAADDGAHLAAATLYQRAAAADPGLAARWLPLGAAQAMAAGDLTLVRTLLDDAVAHGADEGATAVLRARLLAATHDVEGTVALCREMAARVGDADLETALHLFTEPIGSLVVMNRSNEAIELAGLAAGLAARHHGPPTSGTVRATLAGGVALCLQRRHREGVPLLAAWRDLVELEPPSTAVPFLAHTVALLYSYSNERQQAIDMLESLLTACRVDRAGGAAVPALSSLTVAYYGNDFARCVARGDEMLTLAEDTGQVGLVVAGVAALAMAGAACGDGDACRRAVQILLELDEQISAYAALAKLALYEGDAQAAVDALQAIERDPRSRTTHHRWQSDFAEALWRLGAHDEAELQLKRLADTSAPVDPWANGQIARVTALMTDDDEEALAHFARAADHMSRNRHNHYADGLIYFNWGQRVRRMRRRAEARRVLGMARERFAQCGAHGWVDRCDQELAAAGDGRANVPAAQALTVVERTVAELIADGCSNREVGARLFISPRTVETHVSAIYRKLGLKGRAALASWVRAGG